ncbi:hypothetical protein T11_16044, partial [Trichinella zimbabwensis]
LIKSISKKLQEKKTISPQHSQYVRSNETVNVDFPRMLAASYLLHTLRVYSNFALFSRRFGLC